MPHARAVGFPTAATLPHYLELSLGYKGGWRCPHSSFKSEGKNAPWMVCNTACSCWDALSFWLCLLACLLSCFSRVQLFATLWTVTCQVSLPIDLDKESDQITICPLLSPSSPGPLWVPHRAKGLLGGLPFLDQRGH